MVRRILGTALLLLACASAALIGCRDAGRGRGSADPPPDRMTEVTIDNFTFKPAELTVSVGTTVVWVNHDDVPHTVVATTRAFSSPALDTDGRYAHAFGAAGTYAYVCGIHPHMTARVIVK
jgi:plastocyanin